MDQGTNGSKEDDEVEDDKPDEAQQSCLADSEKQVKVSDESNTDPLRDGSEEDDLDEEQDEEDFKYAARELVQTKIEEPEESQIKVENQSFTSDIYEVDGQIFCCDFCDYASDKQSNLRMHHSRKHKNKPDENVLRSCEECDYTCFKIDTLRMHKHRKHSNRVQPADQTFACDLCDYTCDKPDTLRMHKWRNIHAGKKPEDEMVQYRVGKSEAGTSEGEKPRPFKCLQCDQYFTKPSELKYHIKGVHDKIKDHICEICAKGFSTTSQLNSHMIVHSNVKNFPCDICGKSFKSKHYLIIHTRIHNGDKPHCCEQCGKSYSDPSALKLHQNSAHAEKEKLSCEVCGKQCHHKANLKRHMVLHSEGGGVAPSELGPGKTTYTNQFKLEVLKKN